MKVIHAPVCEVCKKPILREGIIIFGNANIVDVSKPDGDGGGFVGSNFPRGAFSGQTTFSLHEVRKSHFHWACFVFVAAQAMSEVDSKVKTYMEERS